MSKLGANQRDFSKLPIAVYLIPSTLDSAATSSTPPRVEAQLVDATLVRGRTDANVFVRVTYPREMLKPGVQIVGQRTAVAETGETVISQTRCRIREEDAAKWK
jgi:hypothetical protein